MGCSSTKSSESESIQFKPDSYCFRGCYIKQSYHQIKIKTGPFYFSGRGGQEGSSRSPTPDLTTGTTLSGNNNPGHVPSAASRPRPALPAVGTIGNLTLIELRALYVSLHPAYVGSTNTFSEATLRRQAQQYASTMSEEQLRAALRNIRYYGSDSTITNPRPPREDTPPRTSNAGSSSAPNSAAPNSGASTANSSSNSRSGR